MIYREKLIDVSFTFQQSIYDALKTNSGNNTNMSDHTPLIEWREDTLSVGISYMDDTHREFIDIINQLGSTIDEQFPALFNKLIEHTQTHFQNEDIAMEKSGFPPISIHRSEHDRIFNEIKRLASHVDKNDLDAAKDFVCRYLPEWFPMHAATMDRALAWHLKTSGAVTD